MIVVTWNVQGLDEQSLLVRMEAAVQEIILGCSLASLVAGALPKAPPSLIFLQEVTRTSWGLLRDHLQSAGFWLFPEVVPEQEYFELTAVGPAMVVQSSRSVPLPGTLYGRNLHILDLQRGEVSVRAMQAHFDSGPERRVASIRVAQAQAIVAELGEDRLGLFGGDTNLRDREWSEVNAGGVKDAWEAMGSPALGRFTWPAPGMNGRKARFDRLWLHPRIQIERLDILGLKPVPGLNRLVSDHLGLRAELTMPVAKVSDSCE